MSTVEVGESHRESFAPRKRGEKQARYITAVEIVIPAGTEVTIAPDEVKRHPAHSYASALLGMTKDSTSEWTMPLSEALQLGFIKQVD